MGYPSGSLEVEDETEENAPVITEDTNYLGLYIVDKKTSSTETTYTFYYKDTVKNENAKVTHNKDFAGYKIYISNTYDGEYALAGKVGELWGAQVTVSNSKISPTLAYLDTLDLDGDGNTTEYLVDTVKNPLYVRVSIYDYFGNETALSVRSINLNKTLVNGSYVIQ